MDDHNVCLGIQYNQATMTLPVDSQNKLIVEHVRRALDGVVAVYRFGSTARGTATDASDTDVAILARARVKPERRFEVQESLAAQLGCDVDFVDLASASTVMAMQVIADGQLLYEDASGYRGDFEDLTFGAYARLNEERREILDRVAAERTVYGR
jgi:predicted nucleotidyltransferase